MPVRLVVGERDVKFRAIAEEMAHTILRAEVTVVPIAGRAVHLEEPEAMAEGSRGRKGPHAVELVPGNVVAVDVRSDLDCWPNGTSVCLNDQRRAHMSSPDTTGTAEASGGTAGQVDPAEGSRRLLEETFNDGNVALVDQLVSPDAVNHDPAEPARMRALRGPEVFKQTVQMYRAAFPDVRITIDDVIAADDKVAVRWHSEGTHRGKLEGLAPTGARGTVTGISIDQWKDGKVVESWTEWDNFGLARQLGAAPAEGSFGEKLGMTLQRIVAKRMLKKNQG
jgi:steroid delta-isomerase-like uncharacterized protein